MVSDLGMRDISAGGSRHVALRAVGLVGVVLVRKVGSMAGQALVAIVGDSFFGGRLVVRIVTTGAGHGISRFPLAHALRHGLDLADPAQTPCAAVQNVIAHVIKKRFPGLEVISVASGTLNRDLAFQMALHANCVAPLWRELGGVHNGSGCPGNVCCAWAVAAFAADASMKEGRPRV